MALAALVGIIIGATIGVLAFTHKGTSTATSTPSPTSTPGTAVKIVGIVSFTASGGLSDSYTISLPDNATPASSIQKGASAKVLEIVVSNTTMDFELTLSPYPGPGSYTLLPFQTNPAPGSFSGTVRISNHQDSWSLQQSGQCKVTIASDTPLNLQVQKKPLDEVKGTFTCSKLASSGSAAAIKITQGQFDVYALILG